MEKISIKNEAEACIIDIEGTIGIPEEWQFEYPDERVATYEGFREAVQRIADLASREIIVNIRSTGGDVNDALLIYEALCATGAHITTRCYGYTASAATLIAQAASEGCRELASGVLYLIHNSICATEGNAEELEVQTALLRKTDERLAEIYASRAGGEVETFRVLMAENNGRGRWLSPEEALDVGLADRIMEHHKMTIPPDEESIQEEASEKPQAITRNIANGWRRLWALLHEEKREAIERPQSDDRNFLHAPLSKDPIVRSSVAFCEGQQQAHPTHTAKREDPSMREKLLSANAAAYAEDLKSFCGLR